MGLLNRRSTSEPNEKVEKEITIVNRLGLHARPAAMFVRIASRHSSCAGMASCGKKTMERSISDVDRPCAAGQNLARFIRTSMLS